MSFAILNKPLSDGDGKGLEVFDPRLAEITGLTQEGKFVEAVAAIDAVMAEELFDLRLLGFYVYGVFLERGLACLEEAFPVLTLCFTENWGSFGPQKNKEKHAKGTLVWLFNQLEKTMARQESVRGPSFLSWIDTVDATKVASISAALADLRTATESALGDHSEHAIEAISKVSSWLSAFERSVYTAPAPEPEAEPEPEAAGATGASEASVARAPSSATMVEGSVHLQLLLKKLEAFEALFKQGDLSRAAIVADDLMTVLGDFDPRKYFPSIFASFFKVLALNVSAMEEHFQGKGGTEWQAMNDFYQVDLDGFIDPESKE